MLPLESTAESEAALSAPTPASPAESAPPPMQLDIVYGRDRHLLLYGWMLGFGEDIETATVCVDDWSLELTSGSIRLARPDVSVHFPDEASAQRDDHGFYLLAALPPAAVAARSLRVRATTRSGTYAEYVFEIDRPADDSTEDPLVRYLDTLKALVEALPADEATRLRAFVGAAVPRTELDPPMRFVVDYCGIIDGHLLVIIGWLLDPFQGMTSLTVEVGTARFDFEALAIPAPRADLAGIAAPFRQLGLAVEPGFFLAAMLPGADSLVAPDAATFLIACADERIQITHPLKHGWTARREFLTLLEGADADAVMTMCRSVVDLLPAPPADHGLRALVTTQSMLAAARLPTTLHGLEPWYQLVIDQAVVVADRGIFLLGWFAAAPQVESQMTLTCRAGDATYDVRANWVRCARADVSSHLAQRGVGGGGPDHGFLCFVPTPAGSVGSHLSIKIGSGAAKRVRIATAPAAEVAMQTVRMILMTFNGRHPQLGLLLDRHVGPAVEAAWSARYRAPVNPTVEHFGTPPDEPAVSVIVPLFGRHDFVEYQLALFADDADFRNVELIYVVDDPFIFEEFRALCDGFFGMYRIPFSVVFPHANLGFAGANNGGAAVARGKHLVLMNSDVMPRENGWIGAMLQAYRSTPGIGVLGVKLLYENGSVQHAGMEFRRSTVWANMWINYHPYKGQSGLGLTGFHAIDAVTAACIMIEADLYRTLGGLSEEYIVGDFEDSDLCLRALEAGRRNFLALDIELYHLERQSQNRVGDGLMRTNLSIYNCWRHTRRWSSFIENLRT